MPQLSSIEETARSPIRRVTQMFEGVIETAERDRMLSGEHDRADQQTLAEMAQLP